MGESPSDPSEELFGQLLVAQGLAKPEHIEECLKALQEISSQSVSPRPRLTDLLVKRGYITLEQFQQTMRVSDASASRPAGSAVGGALPPEAEQAIQDASNLVGRYVRVNRIGAGGMGEVWRAWDRELRRWVALKFLKGSDPDELARFQREAHTAAKLGHPSIAAIYDVGSHDGHPFIAMQLIPGDTLAKFPRDDRRRLVALVRDAAVAVHYAHEQGVVHRDLKPHNIMVDGARTGNARVYVLDFGLAKQTSVDSSLSVSGNVLGTPAYMSPEQARGRTHEADARSDVYSLGATLYDLMADQPPFRADTVYELLRKVVDEEPKPLRRINPRIDADIETIVEKCLEKDPERRYPTAQELADDLQRSLDGEPVVARPPSLGYRLRKQVAKNALLSVAVASSVAILIAAGSVLLVSSLRRAAVDEAAGLCRRAVEKAQEARALLRVRASRREQWTALFLEALRTADAAVARHPAYAGGHYTRGEILTSQRRWREAIEAFGRAIALEPTLAEAWQRRALCKLELYDEALTSTLTVDPTRRPRDDAAGARGISAEPLRREALADLERYAGLREGSGGGSFDATCADATSAFSGGRHPEALELCDRLIQQVPTDERPRLLRAKIQMATGQLVPAVETLDALIRDVMPHFGPAYVARGVAKGRMGDYAGERSDCERAIELDPGDASAHFNLAWAHYATGSNSAAVEAATRALELDPARASSYHLRAVAEAGINDLECSLADATRAIELDPKLARSFVQRGIVRELLGDHDGATADLEAAIRIDPREEEAWYHRGRSRRERGDLPGAIEDCTRAVELDPRHLGAYYVRGLSRADRSEWTAAIADLTKTIELKPTSTRAHAARGRVRLALKDFEGARSDLKKAVELDATLQAELAPLVADCEKNLPPK